MGLTYRIKPKKRNGTKEIRESKKGSESGTRIVPDYDPITFFIFLYSVVKRHTTIVAISFPKTNYILGAGAAPNRCFHHPSREDLEGAILPLKPHSKQPIPLLLRSSLKLPLFNLDCLWRPLEQTPAAVAGS